MVARPWNSRLRYTKFRLRYNEGRDAKSPLNADSYLTSEYPTADDALTASAPQQSLKHTDHVKTLLSPRFPFFETYFPSHCGGAQCPGTRALGKSSNPMLGVIEIHGPLDLNWGWLNLEVSQRD